ncbi:SCO4225 family membrane protein [Streptomyces sp. NPDC002932]|uniref:SCO4225 family membrane protein n=1 Tax=Streptomyces sp. NPDC002932 TaxID=3364672 RepID=UPI0036A8BAC4
MTRTDPDPDSARSVPRRLRDHLGVVGLGYLGACAVLLVWALVVTAIDSSGESMAGVIPVLATAPASLVFLVLPGGTGMFIAAIALGAGVNAAIIGWCTRALRRGGRMK